MANTKITNPELFNLGDSTSATQLPVMTTTQRTAMTGLSTGEMIFNSTTDKVEYWDGTKWYGITYEVAGESPYNNVLYTGNRPSTQTITGVGFQPDLVWIKNRDSGSYPHVLTDSVRGNTKFLQSSYGDAELTTTSGITAFGLDGFSVGANGYFNGGLSGANNEMVAWCWKAGGTAVANADGSTASQVSANVAGGFSIVKFSGGNSSGTTVGHGLSAAPELIIAKNVTTANTAWLVFDPSSSLTTNASTFTLENSNNVLLLNYNYAYITYVLDKQFGGTGNGGSSSQDIIAYCFHSVAGYSKVGSYTGTGANMTVDVGFQPAFVMIKNTTNSASWHIFDNKRTAANPSTEALFPNENSAGADYNGYFVFTSTGFNNKLTSTSLNSNGSNYIYLAFA